MALSLWESIRKSGEKAWTQRQKARQAFLILQDRWEYTIEGWIEGIGQEYTFERLSESLEICITREHRFGTDAFLLADFARVRRKDVCCDLCSGCGIVALIWMRHLEDAPRRAYCVELQPMAVRQLQESVRRSGLEERVFPVLADLRILSKEELPFGMCDLVACNPPYKAVGRGIPSQEATSLLARHEVACTLEDVCQAAAKLLRFGGRFCLCQRPERLADALLAMRANGIEPKRLRMVQKRADTAPWLVLVEGKRGANPFLQVEAPFLIEQEDGTMSPELVRLYGLGEER